MTRLSKFLSLARDEKLIFCEACLLLTLASFGVKTLPFRHIESLMRARWYVGTKRCANRSEEFGREISLVKFSLARASNTLPWNTLCLSRSIAGFVMLSRRGVPAVMFAGVKLDGSDFRAHAWVQAGREALTKNPENAVFTPLIRIEPSSVDTGRTNS